MTKTPSFFVVETREHKTFRITIVQEDGKFVAWIERLNKLPIVAGLGIGNKIGTHAYDRPGIALDAARQAIDSGEIK